MDPLPHFYTVSCDAGPEEVVLLKSAGVADLPSTPPVEFGGSGSEWSPEGLLVAAVADCYILTFKALATHTKFSWDRISCQTRGTLERIDRVTRFTQFDLEVSLQTSGETDEAAAERLLAKAKVHCLITNSLNAQCTLATKLVTS